MSLLAWPEIRKRYVEIADGQLHLAERAGQGMPIVFIHKTVSTFRMWVPVASEMPKDRHLIIWEMPGFGESFDPTQKEPIEKFGAWIAEGLDALGIARCHLVGHHTGAVVAMALADARPDLVETLTLIGPAPMTQEERAANSKKFGPPFTPNETGSYLIDTWGYVRWAGAKDPMLANREMAAMLRSWQARSWTYAAVWDFDFTGPYQRAAMPMLIMCAPDDVLITVFDRAKELRPDARAVLLSGGENYQTDRVPGEIATAVIAFLEDHEK